jgi:uncharacterized protein YdhG (YjbR/CyaY superfamily)
MPGRSDAGVPTPSAQIDTFLATLSPDMRSALQALRETIAASAPEAEEAISYGAPAFRYRGRPLVSYGAAKGHGSFYVMSPDVLEAHRAQVSAFDTSKGTIRFTPGRPLPEDLVARLVRARIAQTDAAATRR